MNGLPEHLKRRIPVAGTAVFLVMVVIATWAIVELCTNSRDSYAALAGARKLVTVENPCDADVCDGTWDDGTGRIVTGTIHLRQKLSEAPPRPFKRFAMADGETAYLDGTGHRHFDGLAAPWLLLGAALEISVQVVLERRRERRRQTAIRLWQARYGTALT